MLAIIFLNSKVMRDLMAVNIIITRETMVGLILDIPYLPVR